MLLPLPWGGPVTPPVLPLIRCIDCKRPLTNALSRKLGRGPGCRGGDSPSTSTRTRRVRIVQPELELAVVPAGDLAVGSEVTVYPVVLGCGRCQHLVPEHWPDDERGKPGCHRDDCPCSNTPDDITGMASTAIKEASRG